MKQVSVLKKRLGADCAPEKAFWTTDGAVIRNVVGLTNTIAAMRPESFRYHVNKDHNKNDFADWIRDVFNNTELARALEGVLGQKKYVSILKKYLKKSV